MEVNMNGKKAIVLYSTRNGHSKVIAEKIAALLKTNAVEIIDAENRKGVIAFIKAGFQASTNKASPIKEPNINLKEFDTVILVQPIWASSVLPPLRTWLRNHKSELTDKRLALFTSSLGSSYEIIKPKFEEEFGSLIAISGVIEKDEQEYKDKIIEDFAKKLLS